MAGAARGKASWRRLTRWTIGLWLLGYFWLEVAMNFMGRYYGLRSFVTDVPSVSAALALAVAVQWLVVRSAGWRFGARAAAIAAAALGAAMLTSFVDTASNYWFAQHWLPDMRSWATGTVGDWVRSSFIYSWVYSLNVCMLMLLLSGEELSVARADAAQAQLAMLRYQLNPHFMFNTLNAISSLVVTRQNERADLMIDRLSGFLRASLSSDPAGLVPLDEELEVVEEYLEVEKVRFGERLLTRFDVPEPLGGLAVPSFLLQPLVENAIKYAVGPSARPVTVAVSARAEMGTLLLEVADDGTADAAALPAAGTGIGLANIRARLAAFYGKGAEMACERLEPGYRVTLRLPARPA